MYKNTIEEGIERIKERMRNLEKQMENLISEIDKTRSERCPNLIQYNKLREDYDQMKQILDIFEGALKKVEE